MCRKIWCDEKHLKNFGFLDELNKARSQKKKNKALLENGLDKSGCLG